MNILKRAGLSLSPDSYNHVSTDLAAQLCDKVNSTAISEGKQCITPSIAIGISQYGVAGITIENALDQAFKASAEKQMDGNSGYKIFSPKIDNAEGAKALRSALELNRLVIKYQPIIALQDQEKHFYDTIIYIENDAGVIEPANKLIENLGIEKTNAALDRWLLTETINTLKTGDKNNIQLTIPLTVSAIMDDEFFPWLENIINESGVSKTAFIFSITASDATDYESNTLQLITLLKHADLNVCLTNANNDYIELIQKLSPNILQLTANLTEKISGEEAEPELIKNMISFANEHNTICIARGVNSANDLAKLWQTGIGFVQGSYLQSPQSNMDYEFTNIAG
ncbi:EAL domain-containing protein [Pseudomonadales bacterium]|nr:EAL domain-containing protein [Pseudomonadales bacterium]